MAEGHTISMKKRGSKRIQSTRPKSKIPRTRTPNLENVSQRLQKEWSRSRNLRILDKTWRRDVQCRSRIVAKVMLELPSFHKAIDTLAMGHRVWGFFGRDELSMISKGLSWGQSSVFMQACHRSKLAKRVWLGVQTVQRNANSATLTEQH
jgi:hypothetical protein